MEFNNSAPGKDISNEDLESKIPRVAGFSLGGADHAFAVSGIKFGGGEFPIFAGPNMVESEELIVDIAHAVKSSGAQFLRGGAFKPLTFPYRNKKYTETRELGLKWLGIAKREANIPVITEIMEERFLDLACEVTDIIQIGARNMQNYPLITAAASTGLPIMIKRHFGASLRDFLGAAEYALCAGNDKVILCERGISVPHTHRATSRFLLDLQIVPAIKEITDLPVIIDSTHACFWRPWVPSLSLASAAVGSDGLMVEVHPDPSNAAVDPLQSIDYDEFSKLVPKLRAIRHIL